MIKLRSAPPAALTAEGAVCELMAEGDVSAQQLVEKVEEAVKTFVGDAEQSDDLTMLALKYTGLS